MVRLPDGRLHLISAITAPKSVSTSSSTTGSVSQTLPASTVRPTTAPRTMLIGSQRFILSSTPGTPLLLTPGSVADSKVVSGLSARPQLVMTSPGTPTVIRMSSGQHVMLRPTHTTGGAVATPRAASADGLSPAQGLFVAGGGKSPPSSPYAVTPEVVQQGNQMLLLRDCLRETLKQKSGRPDVCVISYNGMCGLRVSRNKHFF